MKTGDGHYINRDPRSQRATLSRRAFGLGAVAGAASLSRRAGLLERRVSAATSAQADPLATPVLELDGFSDPERWTGRTLRVGGLGGLFQDGLREGIWRPFAAATGCEIHETLTDLWRLEDSLADGDAYADVMLVDSAWAIGASDRGIIERLDVNTAGLHQADLVPAVPHGAPAYAYAMVSAYRRDVVTIDQGPPADWTAWWDRQGYPGNRALAKGAFGTFEFALLASGVPPSDLYPLDLDRAIDSLREISGRVIDRWWETGDQPMQWLTSGRADFSSAWNYRIALAQSQGYPVELIWNQGLLVADVWVIPRGARNADVAHDFMRFALNPEIQAILASRLSIGPVSASALELLDPVLAATLPTSPVNISRLVVHNAGWWADYHAEADQRFNQWLLGDVDVESS